MAIREHVGILLAKKETTYGTDATPAAANAVQLLAPPTFNLANDSEEVGGVNSAASMKEPVIGAKWYDIQLEFANKGSGTAGTAPEFGPLLEAGGWSHANSPGTSDTYTPDLSEENGATLWWYEDGLLYKARGCRGKAAMDVTASSFGKWTWQGKGMVSALPADASLVSSPVYDTTKAPANINGTFTWDSYAAALRSISLDSGITATEMKALGETYGVSSIELDRFNITGNMVIEHVLVATKALESLMSAGTSGALNLVLGGTAGNITTITSSNMKFTSATRSGNGGIRELSLDFKLSESSSLKDDMTIVYT